MGYRIRFGLPGPSADWGAIEGMMQSSVEHEVTRPKNFGHGHVGNFDNLWNEANNAHEAGDCDLYVMMHGDVHPLDADWLDVMVEVMDRRRVPLVSAVVAIKDNRQVVSSGLVMDPSQPWVGRMIKLEHLKTLPLDFDAADLGHPGNPLLHNNGCILFDLRDDRWRATDAEGNSRFCWNFPRRNRRNADGLWVSEGNSEDWQFSRAAHEMGIPSVLTRRVRLAHRGTVYFPNYDPREELEAQRLKPDPSDLVGVG